MTTLADPADLRAAVAVARAQERERYLSPLGRRQQARVAGLAVLAAGFVITVLASLAIGARGVAPQIVFDALTAFDPTNTEHLVITDLRLPRTILGIAVGAGLAVAGALMQALTRNPLADPGLLGVNSGAAVAVVFAIWVFGITATSSLIWFAFAGAGSVAAAVYALGSLGRGGATPVRLALAGAAIHALLFSLVSGVLILSQETLDTYRFWVVGSLVAGQLGVLVELLPFLALGFILAAVAALSLNAVALGDDAARALGTKLGQTRILTVVAVTLLCGTAVSVAGPIGFLGLVVPHAARAWCGADQRWLMAYCALLGPIVLILSDIAGRVVLPPGEVQVGIMMAVIGGPLFVAVVRRMRLSPL